MTSSTCLPRMPPALLTAASASFAPFCAQSPCSAAGPVTGTHMPILMVAPCALALVTMWGAAMPATIPAAKSRLVSFIHYLREAGLLRRPFLVLASSRDAQPDGYLRTLT